MCEEEFDYCVDSCDTFYVYDSDLYWCIRKCVTEEDYCLDGEDAW